MITNFILVTITFILVLTAGICVIKYNSYIEVWKQNIGALLVIIGIVGTLVNVLFGGVLGAFGYSTTKIYNETEFSKALSSDFSKVIIVYKNKPYIFDQYSVVNNFNSITNLGISESKSLFGCELEYKFFIVTPSNTPPKSVTRQLENH